MIDWLVVTVLGNRTYHATSQEQATQWDAFQRRQRQAQRRWIKRYPGGKPGFQMDRPQGLRRRFTKSRLSSIPVANEPRCGCHLCARILQLNRSQLNRTDKTEKSTSKCGPNNNNLRHTLVGIKTERCLEGLSSSGSDKNGRALKLILY